MISEKEVLEALHTLRNVCKENGEICSKNFERPYSIFRGIGINLVPQRYSGRFIQPDRGCGLQPSNLLVNGNQFCQ